MANKNYKNKYFLLRHGKNIHQTEKNNIVYGYPDDNPPCELIPEGIEEVKNAGMLLKEEKIDIIVCSDTLRTRQTAEIIADIIGFKNEDIKLETRLRDKNWGIFGGRKKTEVWDYYNGEKIKAFDIAPEGGENWQECQQRIVDVFNELENRYNEKTILIISHSNPLWLLDGYLNNKTKQEMLDEYASIIKTGEVRKI
ncbi:MAG: histidine phosphatase family protein [Candidatus Pacebacteria bacterium]|nr:histidine phosphatase family protein [Candidatus Paceibacterota bacterium]